jgi:hypothetical protein
MYFTSKSNTNQQQPFGEKAENYTLTRPNFLDIIGYAIGSHPIAILPGRLMVGRMTLDHVVEGSTPSPAANLFCGAIV